MVAAKHKPVIKAPYYADQGDGVLLHRYLDEDFVPRHLQELQNDLLKGSSAQKWRQQDRFAKMSDFTWLRLPVHRTFYMVNCEVVCDQPGFPALSPDRIIAAGFVIRRKDGRRWILNNGIAQGWQQITDTTEDPNYYRNLVQRKLIRPQMPEPLPSGEETYPLHARLVSRQQSNGRIKKHTLLYGYVPLGGSVQADIIEQRQQQDYFVDTLAWPFGGKTATRDKPASWRRGDGHLLVEGKASEALNGLMQQLIGQYQILDTANEQNQALTGLLKSVYFYQLPQRDRYIQVKGLLQQLAQVCTKTYPHLRALNDSGIAAALQHLAHKGSILPAFNYPRFDEPDDFLEASLLEPLLSEQRWLAEVKREAGTIQAQVAGNTLATQARDEAQGIMTAIGRAESALRALKLYLQQSDAFRGQNLHDYMTKHRDRLEAAITIDDDAEDFFAGLGKQWHLFISEQQALAIREQLFLRAIALTRDYVDSLRIPRFQQNDHDVYYLKPFIRYRDEQGCERVCWSDVNSEPFRVAAPFDPEASRPHSIQMPTLSDLKRGLAKGATFMTPKDLADKLKKMTKDIPPEEKEGSGLGLEWIISFSIPVVTICAMILLMIIINLLNLIFQWLPYAITFIPKPR